MAREPVPRSSRPRFSGCTLNRKAPGRRARAALCPPPAEPRAVHSCSDRAPLAKLEVDLASEAVAERQVDEREHRDEERERQPRNSQRDQKHRRNRQEDAAEALGEVVWLGAILHRPRLDDAARLEDLEIDLLEQ